MIGDPGDHKAGMEPATVFVHDDGTISEPDYGSVAWHQREQAHFVGGVVAVGIPEDSTEDDAEIAILDLAADLQSRGVYMLDSGRVRTLARMLSDFRDNAERNAERIDAISGGSSLSGSYSHGSAHAYGVVIATLTGLFGGVNIDKLAADPTPLPDLDAIPDSDVIDVDALRNRVVRGAS